MSVWFRTKKYQIKQNKATSKSSKNFRCVRRLFDQFSEKDHTKRSLAVKSGIVSVRARRREKESIGVSFFLGVSQFWIFYIGVLSLGDFFHAHSHTHTIGTDDVISFLEQ